MKEVGVIYLVSFIYKTVESILEPTVKLYLYESTCRALYVDNQTICISLENNPDEEIKVQQLSAYYLMVYNLLLFVPTIFWGLLCGAWSDRVGRKLPIILSLLGTILAASIFLLSTFYEHQQVGLIFAGAGVNGIFGKGSTFTMAAHSYVTDMSDDNKRTNYIGQLKAMYLYGMCIGSVLAGICLQFIPYVYIFLICAATSCLNMLILVVLVKESKPSDNKVNIGELFNTHNVKDSLAVVYKKRDGGKQCIIILFLSFIFTNQMCNIGHVNITLLYVQKAPLSWSNALYGYLLSFDYFFTGICLTLVLPVLTKTVNIVDKNLFIIGCLSKSMRFLMLGFSTRTWMVFMSVVIGGFREFLSQAAKSILSKTVDKNEVGKMFSLISCNKLAGIFVFASLYSLTVDIYPGTVFCVQAGLYICMIIIVIPVMRKIDDEQKPLLEKSISSEKNVTREVSDKSDEDSIISSNAAE